MKALMDDELKNRNGFGKLPISSVNTSTLNLVTRIEHEILTTTQLREQYQERKLDSMVIGVGPMFIKIDPVVSLEAILILAVDGWDVQHFSNREPDLADVYVHAATVVTCSADRRLLLQNASGGTCERSCKNKKRISCWQCSPSNSHSLAVSDGYVQNTIVQCSLHTHDQ